MIVVPLNISVCDCNYFLIGKNPHVKSPMHWQLKWNKKSQNSQDEPGTSCRDRNFTGLHLSWFYSNCAAEEHFPPCHPSVTCPTLVIYQSPGTKLLGHLKLQQILVEAGPYQVFPFAICNSQSGMAQRLDMDESLSTEEAPGTEQEAESLYGQAQTPQSVMVCAERLLRHRPRSEHRAEQMGRGLAKHLPSLQIIWGQSFSLEGGWVSRNGLSRSLFSGWNDWLEWRADGGNEGVRRGEPQEAGVELPNIMGGISGSTMTQNWKKCVIWKGGGAAKVP